MDKKFIIVNDKTTADKLMSYGFNLISNIGNTYTFINTTPKNFSFDCIDKSKMCFSNILRL